jgi:hypothetical protein
VDSSLFPEYLKTSINQPSLHNNSQCTNLDKPFYKVKSMERCIMKIEGVARIVNDLCSDRRYAQSRDLILSEWNRITENKAYHLLNDDAKQLVKIIKEEQEKGALSKAEKKILNLINESIKELKLPYAKRIFIENKEWMDKPEARGWLTSDARYICDAWTKSLPVPDVEVEQLNDK